ncbi:MFS transporter [Actinomycetospora sp. CA-084318]|uniref:MFS transporter n=1 Tax=Actinomycetospora sp. CA-084318 TaxID=3239892 RepID=UPI003D97A271
MTAPPDTARSATRSVLSRRDFQLLLASFTTSRVGDFLYAVALIAYVYGQTQSAAWVSAATLGRFIPGVVLSPLAGVLADRYERKAAMALSELAQLVAMTALTVVAALSGPALVVVVLSTLGAAASTMNQAAASALVAATVPEDELTAANSLMSTVSTVAFTAGPAIGGLLLIVSSATVAFGINAATFAVSAAFLLAMRSRSRPTAATEHPGPLRELRDGIGVFLGNRTVALLVLCLTAGTVVFGVELVALVLVSTDLLGTGEQGLGWLLAASGAGGVVGAALTTRLGATNRPRLVIAVLTLLTGLPFASLAWIELPVLAYVVLLVEGAAIVALEVLVETAMQRGISADALGRVYGLVLSLTAIGTALGTAAAPLLIDGLGLQLTLVLVGVIPVALAAASLVLLRHFDADMTSAGRALAPRVRVLEQLRMLEGADLPTLERLADAAVEETVPAGSVVIRQGDVGGDVFVLVDGTLLVEHTSGGVTRQINEMDAPDYFGEIGLVQRTERTATVTASSTVTLWRIPGPLFLEAATGQNTMSSALSGAISTRLARTPGALA